MVSDEARDDIAGDAAISVDAGACRFKTRIMGTPKGSKVTLVIESDCPCVKELAKELESLEVFESLRLPYSDNPVFREAGKALRHSTCPVPVAILKCVETAAGLALKRDVKMEFEK
ncbi:MAG: hypothetical protein LUQ27_00160 [Methanomassiliicoccales archaeon]|nr:hypothetical protein [Methanomassiliicoccales archaeon]